MLFFNQNNQNKTVKQLATNPEKLVPSESLSLDFQNDYSDLAKIISKAKEEIRQEKFEDALTDTLNQGFWLDIKNSELYQLAKECSLKLGWNDLAGLYEAVSKNFFNLQGYFDLGYILIDLGFDNQAIPFLRYVNQIIPQDTTVAVELAIAYAADHHPAEGVEVLKDLADLDTSFWAKYQYHWCKLLTSNITKTQDFINEWHQTIKSEDKADNTKSNSLKKLQEVLNRFKTFTEKPQNHLRNWFFIQYGSVVLDFSSYPTNNQLTGNETGIWRSLEITNEHLVKIIGKFSIFASEMNLNFQSLSVLPDPDSQILGEIFSQIYSLPKLPAENKNLKTPNSLVVGANSWNFDNFANDLIDIQQGQIVFCLNHSWEYPVGITADIIGLVSEEIKFPWGGLDSTLLEPQQEKQIVATILQTKTDPSPYWSDLIGFYNHPTKKNCLKIEPAVKVGSAKRSNFITDSPLD